MDLKTIPERLEDCDTYELIEKIMNRNRFLEKRCNSLKRRRELLLNILNQFDHSIQTNKLSESKVSVASGGCALSTQADEVDLQQKYLDEIQLKDQHIVELKEQIEMLEKQIKNLQACNDAMQAELIQRKEFQRNDRVTQSVIINKSTTQTEKAQATLDRFVQPLTTSSFKSIDGQPQTADERKKFLKRMSMQASISAGIMAIKGDYTTLPGAFEEIQSNKSFEQ